MIKLSPKTTFNILFVGDIFGRVGRHLLSQNLKTYQTKYDIDLTIVNGENATNGCSISQKHLHQFLDFGVDIVTMGNHTFHLKEMASFIDEEKSLVRPYNLPFNRPGKGTILIERNGLKVQITNLIGNTFMDGKNADLFTSFWQLQQTIQPDLHIVDLHAEATAEKAAFAWAFDGSVTAILGTHTHVQTNDARLLPQQTFFITDVGMTGPYNSVIGAKPDLIVKYELTGQRKLIRPASGDGKLSAVVLRVDLKTKKVTTYKVICDVFPDQTK